MTWRRKPAFPAYTLRQHGHERALRSFLSFSTSSPSIGSSGNFVDSLRTSSAVMLVTYTWWKWLRVGLSMSCELGGEGEV